MKERKLKRAITLPYLVFYGLGNIIGAGIYVLIGEIAKISGYYTPISFFVACLAVVFTALSYAELSSRYPLSAGEAVYVKEGLGLKIFPIIVGFLLIFSGIVSASAVISGFYGYIKDFINLSENESIAVLIIILFLIASWGISESVKFASIFTLIEILGLLLVIFFGLKYIDFSSIEYKRFIPGFDLHSYNLIILGSFVAFYAFIGFEDMVNVAEEVKNPVKTMPKAIIITIFISTLLYFLVAFVSICVIEPNQLAQSPSPLADVFKKSYNEKSNILNFIAIFAIVNGALVQIIMVSRILYGMAKQGWLPKIFSSVNKYTRTPIFSTFITSFLIFLFAYFINILTLAQLTSFAILIVFIMVNLSLIRLKMKKIQPKNIINIPIFVPIIGVLINLILIFVQLKEVI
ncbi:APC family permease [Nitrosophilus kaiyonis]|uniref:APC family permease n=1 Tax=Nitrosophilus kaiyonis TaxID=2930200 RepID=UPI0024933E73|nr:amino acid permease [Nitrosophilus kaiyonis]